jgi:glutaredoxin
MMTSTNPGEFMDALADKILRTFGELQREVLDLHSLFEIAGGNLPARREAVLDAVTDLARQGLLHERGGDFYSLTESGRLAVAAPDQLTLLSRAGCHLCREAQRAIEPILSELGLSLREVNIDEDASLLRRFTDDVPVLFLGTREIARHQVNPDQLRQSLTQFRKA